MITRRTGAHRSDGERGERKRCESRVWERVRVKERRDVKGSERREERRGEEGRRASIALVAGNQRLPLMTQEVLNLRSFLPVSCVSPKSLQANSATLRPHTHRHMHTTTTRTVNEDVMLTNGC